MFPSGARKSSPHLNFWQQISVRNRNPKLRQQSFSLRSRTKFRDEGERRWKHEQIKDKQIGCTCSKKFELVACATNKGPVRLMPSKLRVRTLATSLYLTPRTHDTVAYRRMQPTRIHQDVLHPVSAVIDLGSSRSRPGMFIPPWLPTVVNDSSPLSECRALPAGAEAPWQSDGVRIVSGVSWKSRKCSETIPACSSGTFSTVFVLCTGCSSIVFPFSLSFSPRRVTSYEGGTSDYWKHQAQSMRYVERNLIMASSPLDAASKVPRITGRYGRVQWIR